MLRVGIVLRSTEIYPVFFNVYLLVPAGGGDFLFFLCIGVANHQILGLYRLRTVANTLYIIMVANHQKLLANQLNILLVVFRSLESKSSQAIIITSCEP